MSSNSRIRSLFCLCFVLVLHSAFVTMLPSKSYFPKPASNHLQYVSVAQPKLVPANSLISKPVKKRADLRVGSASNLVSTPWPVIEPRPKSTSSPSNDLLKPDLNTLRANAVQHELRRERSSIELQNEKNRRNQRLEARLEKSAKEAEHTDCRTAYSGTGLFAPLFITADLLRDKGCKF